MKNLTLTLNLKKRNHGSGRYKEFTYDLKKACYICDYFIEQHFKTAPPKAKFHFVQNEKSGLFMMVIKTNEFGTRVWYGYAEKGYGKSEYVFERMSNTVMNFLAKNGVKSKRIRFDVYMEEVEEL